jgi:stage II sporulation protein P
MTHNDESYIPCDNTSSVYGKGGIHDVAQAIKSNFEKQNYTVYLNETLHLPHDSGAYGRSYSTAKSLLEKDVDALFDIHRDGVARSVYVKEIDGVERCKVRIVVGQANPNKDANLQFAMYLVSVAKEYCPWLFLDIYYAKGHYNQALTNKGLLFEMGTYLAEKELVLETVPYLASVVDKTLFSTVVEEDNQITITDTPTTEQQENIVNNILSSTNSNQIFESKHNNNVVLFTFIFIIVIGGIIFLVLKFNKGKLNNDI